METVRTFILLLSCILTLEVYSGKIVTANPSITIDSLLANKPNATLGRGINFGNALEAPKEGTWGLTIKESYIKAVAHAGFNSKL